MKTRDTRNPAVRRGLRLGRTRLALWIAAVAAAISPLRAAGEESARELFQRLVASVPKVSLVARMKLVSAGSARRFELRQRPLSGGVYGFLVEVTDPFDLKDTRFLFLDRPAGPDEQYVYVPNVRRVVRVGPQVREQQFLGSEFLLSDLTLPEPAMFDFAYAGTEAIGERNCRLIDAVPRAGATWPYTKARYAVDPADLLVLRAEFADQKGPVKLWTLVDVEKVDGVWTPRKQRMRHLRDKVESELEIESVQYRVALGADLFTRSYLEFRR